MTWYYVKDGAASGPISDDDFASQLRTGAILPTTLVWRSGLAEWQTASSVADEIARDHHQVRVLCVGEGDGFFLDGVRGDPADVDVRQVGDPQRGHLLDIRGRPGEAPQLDAAAALRNCQAGCQQRTPLEWRNQHLGPKSNVVGRSV